MDIGRDGRGSKTIDRLPLPLSAEFNVVIYTPLRELCSYRSHSFGYEANVYQREGRQTTILATFCDTFWILYVIVPLTVSCSRIPGTRYPAPIVCPLAHPCISRAFGLESRIFDLR